MKIQLVNNHVKVEPNHFGFTYDWVFENDEFVDRGEYWTKELLNGRAAKGELIEYRAGTPMPIIARFDEKKLRKL